MVLGFAGAVVRSSTILLHKSEQMIAKLHIFSIKHKADTCSEHSIRSNDCVFLLKLIPTQMYGRQMKAKIRNAIYASRNVSIYGLISRMNN